EIVKRLKTGRLVAFDKDTTAIEYSTKKLSDYADRVTIVHNDFKQFDVELDNLWVQKVDGILLDLGVSSYQIDTGERGFSYMHDAPLDMRMDTTRGKTAWDVINEYSQEDLVDIFSKYGEEPYSKRIASAIVKSRLGSPIDTTLQLVKIIERSVPFNNVKSGHPAKRVFQALRIEVNGELDELYECIIKMVRRLKPGGRLCIMTFHSLEDKIVKQAYNYLSSDCVCDKKLPICICNHKREARIITKKPIVATEEELKVNSRSHSAKLRIIEKL
ncbi:MAG: 16S rRNA (cytosine(1402)-N(4))-methyltransferase RsmH, partial [Clostridia bacterium]|nr:16S rRNA (cytosine(1402)-N(4))-methyltransferase RsmH [Clostridia bacterium]